MSRIHEPDYMASLQWHSPPELRNEPSRVSFAANADGVYQRIEEPGGTRYSWAPWEQVFCDWRPWTSNPEVQEWTPLGAVAQA